MIFNSCNLEGNLLLKGESQAEVGHTEKKRVHTYVVCACVSLSCTLKSLGHLYLLCPNLCTRMILPGI